MRTYVRNWTPGGTYFFTVNLAKRGDNRLLVEHVDALRAAFRETLARHPARMDAVVIMPDHLHCIWQLPPGDSNFSARWRLIKSRFSRALPTGENRRSSLLRKGERGVWQRRFWEHLIRDEDDYARHADYIHWNPVKHGHVSQPSDWPWSSFAHWVERGIYPPDWGASPQIESMERE